MLSLISAISKFVVTVAPFIILPFAVLFSVNVTLQLSALFLVYNLIVSAIRYGSRGLWDKISVFTEIPLLAVVAGFAYYAFPEPFITAYKHTLDWSGPVLVIVEGVQISRVIVMSGKRILHNVGENPDYLTLTKVVVVGGSAVSYLISAYLTYKLYQHSSMDVPFASFVASTITLLLVLNVISLLVDGAVLSDAALLLLYAVICCRFSLLQFNNDMTIEKVATQSGFFGAWLGSFNVNVTRVFSADYILSSILSGFALFTLSFPTELLEDDEPNSSDPDNAVWEILKDSLFKIAAVGLYTHLILQLVGNITPFSVVWRVIQVILAVGIYIYSLVDSKYYTHEHYD